MGKRGHFNTLRRWGGGAISNLDMTLRVVKHRKGQTTMNNRDISIGRMVAPRVFGLMVPWLEETIL